MRFSYEHQYDDRPTLHIEYAPEFSFTVFFVRAEPYTTADYSDVVFAVHCTIRHPTGRFMYEADDIRFESRALESFAQQLDQIRQGSGESAELADPSPMISFGLRRQGRQVKCSIRIREAQGANELSTLNASFEGLDYDLFVNKLSEQLREFIETLRQLVPFRGW